MLFKGEHVLGFNCPTADTSVNLFANWEYKIFEKMTKMNCTPIGLGPEQTLTNLLRHKLGKKKVKKMRASNKTMHSLQLRAKLTILRSESIRLEISGSYFLNEIENEINFKDEVNINPELSTFNPYYELEITKDKITNFFNDYEGGETLVLDVKELFFINLETVKASKKSIEEILLKNNKAKLYGSLRFKDNGKGSIPVELVWD
jgi:hypothetical protein